MAAELVHKLLLKTGTHIEHREEWGTAIAFTYGIDENHTSYSYPYVLENRMGARYLYGWRNGEWSKQNVSLHQTLTAGTYKAIVGNANNKLSLWKVASYANNELATLIGEYSDGERFTLASDGIYFLKENDYQGFDDLNYSVSKLLREYDEEVVDYSTTIIDEPIGFDDLQMTMKRNDYHGMGAEVSLGELEFYGAAFHVIQVAYEDDIDAEVLYSIEADGVTIYSGQVDLTTCSFVKGDYQSVKAKVGEVGVMTTFNNRASAEIDLNEPKTVDDDVIDDVNRLSLHIPQKHLLYTNLGKQKNDTVVPASGTISIGGINQYLVLPFVDEVYSEFGKFEFIGVYCTDDVNNITGQYDINNGDTDKFGTNTTAHIDALIKATIHLGRTNYWSFRYRLVAKDSQGNTIAETIHSIDDRAATEININSHIEGDLSASGEIKFYLHVDPIYGSTHVQYDITATIKSGSYIKMTMYDNLAEDEVTTDALLVHDALNIVSHAISENALAVKSEWYRTPESHWESGAIRTRANGGTGALKAITNGYHIRGLFTDGELQRNMPMSFKALIEALDALDCIGWGFSTEDNVLCLRVERWDWFYKDTTILTLTDVAEVTTEVYTDFIPTELKIGYKKYATQDQYNSIDSPHGTRTFTSGIKALSKALTKECEFVADNYAIEETRRARNDVNETEETTYDESIFVFELLRTYQAPINLNGGTVTPPSYSIVHSAINATNVGRTNEFINAKLTPRHMAARWRDFLFATNNTTPFRFTSGEINYKSAFKTTPEDSAGPVMVGHGYLTSFAVAAPQKENDDISYIHAKFKAEKITFQCPISIEDYKSVKANPYGLVSVNGVLGWIMDFKYSFYDGMADFTLIAKYTN